MARYMLVAYTSHQMTILGAQKVRCMIVYTNMLSGAWKNVYQDF